MIAFILGLVLLVVAGAMMSGMPWWKIMLITVLISISTNLLNSGFDKIF